MRLVNRLLLNAAITVLLAVAFGCDNPSKTPRHGKPLVVKGLSIGMTPEEIKNVISNDWGSNWSFRIDDTQIEITSDRLMNLWAAAGGKRNIDTSVFLRLDNEKRASEILIPKDCATELFKSSDLSAQDFARQFANSYLDGEMRWNEKFWEKLTADNIQVRISWDKTVSIKRVVSTEQQRRNFN